METTSTAPLEAPLARWSPARIYLVASGILVLALGIAGFVINAAFPTDSQEVGRTSDHLFGVLETNGWHNLGALVSAATAFGFASRPEWARLGAFLKGAFYVVLTAGIAIWGGETFLIAANGPDQVIHAALAVGGLATAAMTRR